MSNIVELLDYLLDYLRTTIGSYYGKEPNSTITPLYFEIRIVFTQ